MKLFTKNELFLLEEIIKKNFSSKYKGSVLGVMWTIVGPLLMMALFTIIFSTIFGRNIENFPVYFLCGWCTYQFFTASISASMSSLKANQNILQRTPTPKYIFVLGGILSEFLNYVIMLVLLIGVMLVTHAPFHFPFMLFSFVPVFSMLVMIIGLGLILSIANVYYTDIQHLWSVMSMFFMYASAIFYPMSIIPEPYRQYLMLNPIYWIIDQFRGFIYYGIFPHNVYIFNSWILSFIILVIGIIVFKKYESKITMKF